MFETLEMAPPDAILGLNEAFKKDSNPEKINLSVGVYQNDEGKTPILDCVKKAETRLLDDETNKSYLGIDGMPEFNERLRQLVFGLEHPIHAEQRAVTLQTPGGTGALRVAADFVRRKFPQANVWCSKPTWANHPAVFEAAGLPVKQYGYLDDSGTGFDFNTMMSSLNQIPAGDVVCLHACCHNPTGVDPTVEQWKQITQVVHDQKLLALVDFAYQGFGDGLAEDSRGLHELCSLNRELLLCTSFSKNFGLYGERVGGFTIVAETSDAAQAALSHAKKCVRANYSNPPKHGAAIVNTILADGKLRSQWESELAEMRTRINGVRQQFVDAMNAQAPDHDFSFITAQRGMFSFSGLSPLQVDELRQKHSIYIVGSGRINVAGITSTNIDRLCTAIASVL